MFRPTSALLLLLSLGSASFALAAQQVNVRLLPGSCGGEVRATSMRPLGSGLPAGLELVGHCNEMGAGTQRRFLILWSAVGGDAMLRPTRLNGAPFGTSIVPVPCEGAACTPRLPDIVIPLRLHEKLPSLDCSEAT